MEIKTVPASEGNAQFRATKPKAAAFRRKAVTVTDRDLVVTRPLASGRNLPIVVEPAVGGIDLISWAKDHRAEIDALLLKHGAVLFRSFVVGATERFAEFVTAATGRELIDYSYRSTPRTNVGGKIYTSTEYPPDQTIPLHNEMSYSRRWPRKICFYCVTPAAAGGETPIADSRRVYARVDPSIRAAFENNKVLYVRNYSKGLDVPWQTVFGTDDQAQVERFCREASIEAEWWGEGGLRTRQVCEAVIRHPVTRKRVWFNQAHLFHVSSVDPEIRRRFLTEFAAEELPRNAYFGNGSAIPEWMLEDIRHAYDCEAIAIAWRAEDVLLMDNIMVAHGRMPFKGTRKVLVGMAELSG